MSRLPDFLIIGAMRSGSTALFKYLAEHPSIFMAYPKEVRYFNKHFDMGIEWYRDHFDEANSDQLAGEATPSYMHHHETVDRMADTVPGARLIAILRDPVDRTYSHYWMDRTSGRADVSFETYLEDTRVLEWGRYAEKLRMVTGRFPKNQLHVVFHEQLRDRPRDLYQEVCGFLGVDTTVFPPSLGRTINPYLEFRSFAFRSWYQRLPPSLGMAKSLAGRLNTRRRTYPPMRKDTREWLAGYFSPLNDDLAMWLGREPPGWTTAQHGAQRRRPASDPREVQ